MDKQLQSYVDATKVGYQLLMMMLLGKHQLEHLLFLNCGVLVVEVQMVLMVEEELWWLYYWNIFNTNFFNCKIIVGQGGTAGTGGKGGGGGGYTGVFLTSVSQGNAFLSLEVVEVVAEVVLIPMPLVEEVVVLLVVLVE